MAPSAPPGTTGLSRVYHWMPNLLPWPKNLLVMCNGVSPFLSLILGEASCDNSTSANSNSPFQQWCAIVCFHFCPGFQERLHVTIASLTFLFVPLQQFYAMVCTIFVFDVRRVSMWQKHCWQFDLSLSSSNVQICLTLLFSMTLIKTWKIYILLILIT